MAAAAAALMFIPWRRGDENLHWSNGLEKDIAKVAAEIEELSEGYTQSADAGEMGTEFKNLEETARSLRKQYL